MEEMFVRFIVCLIDCMLGLREGSVSLETQGRVYETGREVRNFASGLGWSRGMIAQTEGGGSIILHSTIVIEIVSCSCISSRELDMVWESTS